MSFTDFSNCILRKFQTKRVAHTGKTRDKINIVSLEEFLDTNNTD